MKTTAAEKAFFRPLPWWLLLALGILLSLLSYWSWQQWQRTWIEPSEHFFPPEWQNEDLAELAWKYPLYRSNDTYQWVHLADELAVGNITPLYHRFDEGLVEGRPNRWHSGLVYLLRAGGDLTATVHDWPTQRGIHHTAHWLGAALHILAIILGAYLVCWLAGRRAALLFAGLFFFNAAIAWDFAFSRLDHEAMLQLFLLLHLIGLAGLCSILGKQRYYWALLAGISAGICWWISATSMALLSVFTTLGMALECYRQRKIAQTELRKALMLWGGSAAMVIALLCLVAGRLNLDPSIATIHPIFILAQIGTLFFCLATLQSSKLKQGLTLALSLTLGLSPAVWLLVYSAQAHPWLDPMLRRLHDYIVEFQSPLSNQLWSQPENLQAAAIALLAFFVLRPFSRMRNGLFASLLVGLSLLSLMQTRWLGFLAAAATLALCLQLKHEARPPLKYISYGLLLLCLGTWTQHWNTLKEDPGRIFVTDLMLQVGARDLNLNLQRLSEGETIYVAMPYAFAATSALFPEVHPLGTFYWENARGIKASAEFFADTGNNNNDTLIDYVVVQGGRQGAPFAKLVNWVAAADIDTATIEASPAWQFASMHKQLTHWQERPFKGTFGSEQFSIRIYQSTDP